MTIEDADTNAGRRTAAAHRGGSDRRPAVPDHQAAHARAVCADPGRKSLATAFATGIPANQVVPALINGFGTTLGTVALLVGLGAMLGRHPEGTGGAKVLCADWDTTGFGEKRAPFALGVASLIFGFPIFFDAGLVVMLPVVFSRGAPVRRLGAAYALPAAGAFAVMHAWCPAPGPGLAPAACLAATSAW